MIAQNESGRSPFSRPGDFVKQVAELQPQKLKAAYQAWVIGVFGLREGPVSFDIAKNMGLDRFDKIGNQYFPR